MFALTANRLSPSDMWEKKTKEKPTLGSWRDRRRGKEGGDAKGSEGTEEKAGSWRVRKPEKAKGADETAVYADCMPAESKLQKMYKHLKVENNKLITWLVESAYPRSGSLPPYITLSRKEAKDHPKYEIIVNRFTDVARRARNVPDDMMSLLDCLIVERTEYSHWMSRKSSDHLSQISDQNHTYYIQVLREVKIILAERIELEARGSETTKSSPAESSQPEKTANRSAHADSPKFGKRTGSSTGMESPDRRKAAKHSVTTNTHRQEQWRQVVVDTCDKMAEKECVAAVKPMSYASALRVTMAA